MPETVALKLPLLVAEQAQKHVTHNEAVRALDALVQLSVKDRDLTAPPGSPAEGDRYLVAASPTGAWTGHHGDIAAWLDGAWEFFDPREGWVLWVADEDALLVHNGTGFTDFGGALGVLQNLALLGVGTTADATNPFSAKLNKALWTAKYAAEGGDGDLRYTMNKEATSDVVSLLLQKGFSGCAEIGLIGDDDLSFKTSPDGSTYNVGLALDKTTGGIRFLAAQVDVASAATCDIGAAASLKVRITGTTTITSFGTVPHAVKIVLFNAALTLTHNATSLILPGGASITTAAGDCAIATSDSSGNWRVRHYARASGKAVVPPSTADMGLGTAALKNTGTSGDAVPLLNVANTFANNQVFTGFLHLTNSAGTNRGLQLETAGLSRWFFYTTSAAESGGNAGSNFVLSYYNDDGSYGGDVFTIARALPTLALQRSLRLKQYAAASLPSQNSGDMIGSSDIVAAPLVSDGAQWTSPGVKVLNAVAANATLSIPAGWAIDRIFFANTTANAVTGGIKIGTSSGATDVVAAQAVGANALDVIADGSVLKRIFSRSSAQTLYVQAVTAWNSASVELSFSLRKVF